MRKDEPVGPSPCFSIRPVRDDQWEIVGWLWQLFRHDLATIVDGLPYADGRYQARKLEQLPSPDGVGYLAWRAHPKTGEDAPIGFAVVEGLALRIASGDVPPPLRPVSLRALDIGLLQAGASMKGEFEQRLRQVIEEVQASPKPIIMFIDEAHTLVGAGGAAGTGDAANLRRATG